MIDALTGATGTTVPNSGSTRPQISSDFETFLRMLSVQMENQDPLNPIDSSDYAVQLATFSSVEQQVQTNTLLEALTAQISSSGLAEMAAWVGRDARVTAPAQFTGTPITLLPNPAARSESVELIVRNDIGTEVQRVPLPVSADPIQWAGVNATGTPFPSGRYSFEVVSTAGGEVILAEPAAHYATVREVRVDGGQMVLMFDGDVAVPATEVTALRQAN